MSDRVFINLGEVYFGQGDLQVETLLGSCVAITFWHPVRRLGGLCHFLLPTRRQRSLQQPDAEVDLDHPAGAAPDGRYGEEALSYLLDEVRRHGTRVADYTVKVFGGGNILDLPVSKNRVGQINADFALDILQRQHIAITAQDVAGTGYRYLRFDLNNGDVWVRRGHGVMQEMEKLPAARTTAVNREPAGKERP